MFTYCINRTKKDNFHYYYKTKNDLNQIINIEFRMFNSNGKDLSWYVVLYIGKRKDSSKSFENCTQNGKDGLKSLIWAKKCLEDFIVFLENNYYVDRNHTMFIYASDSKRMKVYTNRLKSMGFKKSQNFLYKHIKNKT